MIVGDVVGLSGKLYLGGDRNAVDFALAWNSWGYYYDDVYFHATYLWHRLIVALIFFVPLTDLSLTLSLIPSVRFAGWPYVLIACAAPVALWSAWPFCTTG